MALLNALGLDSLKAAVDAAKARSAAKIAALEAEVASLKATLASGTLVPNEEVAAASSVVSETLAEVASIAPDPAPPAPVV